MKTKSIALILAMLSSATGFSYAHRGSSGGGTKPVPAEYDTDGDGVLSDAEKAAMKADLEAKRAAFIAKYDADGDGVLNAAERAAAKAAMEAAKLEELTAKFSELDTDASGGLSAEEFAAGAPEGAEATHTAAHFARIDADADGSVTLSEFTAPPVKGGKPAKGTGTAKRR